MVNILITGSLGQIGTELSEQLRGKYGKDNIICTDIHKPEDEINGTFEVLDVTDKKHFKELVNKYQIDWIVHNASILSATGEKKPDLAMTVNIRGFENALNIARDNSLRILTPSSIAAFGPTTPKVMTPDLTIMRPTTIYGVSKVYTELLGEYYNHKWGTDFRSVRYPGIISYKTKPMHGTTDYAVAIFYDAIQQGRYTSFLKRDTLLPMLYMPDCLKGTIDLLDVNPEILKQRTYNITGFSLSPELAANAIKKYLPEFTIDYAVDFRQEIADSWPNSLDDSNARLDWDWKNDFDIDAMTKDMLMNLSKQLEIKI